jgi:hypothetical protein
MVATLTDPQSDTNTVDHVMRMNGGTGSSGSTNDAVLGCGKTTIHSVAQTPEWADCSLASRECIDTSRCTVNTHTSILNITEDDEEDDEENADIQPSFLFSDLHQEPPKEFQLHFVPKTPELPSSHWCDIAPTSNELGLFHDASVFEAVTESLVESLCFPREKQVNEEDKGLAWQGYRRILEHDILELLGCLAPPDEDEMEKIWAWNQSLLYCNKPQDHVIPTPPRPRRYSKIERALRIHRMRAERAIEPSTRGSFLSPSPSPTSVVSLRCKSFDERGLSCVKKTQKKNKLQTSPETDVGYDSDPGEITPSILTVAHPRLSLPPRPSRCTTYPFNSVRNVHECFNANWILTWHPSKEREHLKQPTAVSVWMERGTILGDNSVMLEPNLMWRETYQPSLSQRKLNESSMRPYSIRLLNLCRILEAPTDLDRSQFPFARSASCLVLRTAEQEEIVFEAASPEQRNDIVRCWKLVVARFASLAVLEDLDAIFDEFINPMATSPMLVPDYNLE